MEQVKRDKSGKFTTSEKTNLIGKRFGKLKVIRDSGRRIHRKVIWECLCDCNKTTFVTSDRLVSENTRSCGCLKNEFYESHTHNNPTFIEGTEVGLLNPELTYSHNTSGHRGVSQNKKNGKYRAYIQFKKKPYWLGTFINIEEAIEVRKNAESMLFGNFLEWYMDNNKKLGEEHD
ncbi:MAG: hypothetical protein K0R54_822 [Clostridiaceae bacterium]|nr:hypothetical protein [Clostridiaceae bacterium]